MKYLSFIRDFQCGWTSQIGIKNINRNRKVYYRSMPEPSSLAKEAFRHLSRSQCRYTVGGNRAWQEGCSPMRFSCRSSGWRLYLVCRNAYALFPAWEKQRISGPMRLGDKRINRFSKVRRSWLGYYNSMRLISQAVLVLSFFLNGSARDQFIGPLKEWEMGQEMSFPATLPLVVEKRE